MKTVNQLRASAHGNAHKEKQALDRLIAQGYGEDICDTYAGTAYATAKCSNAYFFRRYWLSKGYRVLAEEAGRQRQYRTQGHVVYCVLTKI